MNGWPVIVVLWLMGAAAGAMSVAMWRGRWRRWARRVQWMPHGGNVGTVPLVVAGNGAMFVLLGFVYLGVWQNTPWLVGLAGTLVGLCWIALMGCYWMEAPLPPWFRDWEDRGRDLADPIFTKAGWDALREGHTCPTCMWRESRSEAP